MVCSPSDVRAERAAIVEIIHRWTADYLIDEDVVLVPVLWEDMLPATVEGVDGQTSINEMMTHKADIFIGVFKHRFGVEARAGAEVGTVEEIMIALKAKKTLHLLFYKGEDGIDANNSEAAAQLAKVHDFKARMQRNGIYATYENVHELRELVSRSLHNDVRQFTRNYPRPEIADSVVAGSTTSEAALPEISSKRSDSEGIKVKSDSEYAAPDGSKSKSIAEFHRKPAARDSQGTRSREFPANGDTSSDAPPVSGSEVVYSTQSNVTTDIAASKTVTDRPTKSGLPTRPPTKSAKTGILTSPKSVGNTTTSGVNYVDSEGRLQRRDLETVNAEQDMERDGIPTRSPLHAQGELSYDQQGRLRQKQAVDRERAGKKFADNHSHLTLSEIRDLNKQDQSRKNRTVIDEQGHWVSMRTGDEFPDLDVLQHPAPKLNQTADDELSDLDELKRYKTNPRSRTTEDELEAERRKQELENAESVARWNADLPLKKMDGNKWQLSSELTRHESWTVEPRRGRLGNLLGFMLTLIQNQHVENVQVSITGSEGSEIPVKYSVQFSPGVEKPTQILATVPKSINADVLFIRVTWDLERGRYPQEEHLVLVVGDAPGEPAASNRTAKKSTVNQNRSINNDDSEIWQQVFGQGWGMEIDRDVHGYPSGMTLTNNVRRVAREISVRFHRSDGTILPSNLHGPIKLLDQGESKAILFDPNDLDGQEVTAIVEWFAAGHQSGTKADLGPLEGYRSARIRPVVNFANGILRVTVEGDPAKKLNNLFFKAHGRTGRKLDLGFNPKGYRNLSVGDQLAFHVELSAADTMDNTLEMTWTVDGYEFSAKQQVVLR